MLVLELLKEVPARFFETASQTNESPSRHLAKDLANQLYSAGDIKHASLPETEGGELLASGLGTALALVRAASTSTDKGSTKLVVRTCDIVRELASLTSHCNETLRIAWDPKEWSRQLLHAIQSGSTDTESFAAHAALIRTIISIQKTPTITPSIPPKTRRIIDICAGKLLHYLQSPCSAVYVEAAQLIWAVEALSDRPYIESMVASQLASPDESARCAAFESFGNLWRFTEDNQLPGRVLRLPMLIVLDSLKDDNLTTKRAGEAWMRCSLKSYLRYRVAHIITRTDTGLSFLFVQGIGSAPFQSA